MSYYLLDTNIVSEMRKKDCNKNVANWAKLIPNEALFISVITIGEIRKGIERLDNGKKKNDLISWLDFKLIPFFGNNIIDVNNEIADRWGYISTNINIPAIDGLITATAIVNNLILVTRNVKDFSLIPLVIINPFN